MIIINGIEKIKEISRDIKLSDFRIVRKFCFFAFEELPPEDQYIEMILESEDFTPNLQVNLYFKGISQVSLNSFGGGETRIIGFDIVDISNKGWESLNWEIIDYEHQSINFFSKTAEVISVHEIR